MANNLLGLEPFVDQFYGCAIENVVKSCLSQPTDNLEIEFKFAEFKYFGSNIDERDLAGINNNAVKQKILDTCYYQYLMFKSSLESMSRQNILNLNPLRKSVYMLSAGFDELKHKKFYHIRDFLIKICRFNQLYKNGVKFIDSQYPTHIYHQFNMNANRISQNQYFRIVSENELRMDLYIKDFAPEQLRGRYSYSNISGWKKVNKTPLSEQLDYMLSQRTFRFAVNRQLQTDVDEDMINSISNLLKNNPKITDVRLKRLLRVNKGDICEYSLSQIYNINQSSGLVQFPDKIKSNQQQLNAYIKKLFINFYSQHQKTQIKYEIQSEFTKEMNKKLKIFATSRKIPEIKYEITKAIEELYALFFSDHSTKERQKILMNDGDRSVSYRLENEFGSYMRDELYQKMNQKI